MKTERHNMIQSPFDIIRSCSDDFTKTDQKIAEHILDAPNDVIRHNMASLASLIEVSDAALSRFANRVGYSAFSALKNDISRYVFSHNSENDSDQEEKDRTPLCAITEIYASYMKAIADYTDMDTVNRIADLFLRSKKVKIFGINRTFNSARQFRFRLNKIGFDAEAVDDMHLFSDMADYLGKDDLVIIFTTRNNMHYDSTVAALTENGCHVVVFTMIQNLPYKNLCDEVVVLPRISRDSRGPFLDDQAIYFVFIEVLLSAISERSRQMG